MILDTLKNLVMGLGSSKDKSSGLAFDMRLIGDAELNAMHRSDWLARKIVDIIPNDMTREWRDWQSDGDDIELIEGVEKAPLINLQPKINLALQTARLLRGSAIYMGMRDNQPEAELALDRVGKGDLLYIHVLSRNEVTCGETVYDVTSEFYGQPSYYEVKSKDSGTVRVHPSRMIRFIGAPILDTQYSLNDGWGDSILQIVYDAVQNAGSSQAHVAALIPEAKADVIYIPGLSGFLQNATTTKALTDRFTYANTIKSMFNMVLLEGDGKDAGEKWEQKQINFSQLPELMRQFLQIAAAAADIPITRLMGESPGGMNSTGSSDLKNYYDNIAARQRTELSPALHRLDEVIIRSATGKRDPSTYYEWASLWGLSDTEKATIFKMKADAARALAGSAAGALLPVEALSDALVNAFVEDGSLPGLEAAIDEYGKLSEQEPSEEEIAAAAANSNEPAPTQRQAANDAEPRTLYVRRDVVNASEIAAWAEGQGITDIVPDLHVTIVYSRTPLDWIKAGNAGEWGSENGGKITIAPGGPRVVEPLGNMSAVLMFASSQLCWRHEEIVRAGASHDFEDYQPHISLTKATVDLTKIEPYRGKIVLGPEVFEEVKED